MMHLSQTPKFLCECSKLTGDEIQCQWYVRMQSSLRPVDSLSDEENTNDNPGPQPKIRSPRPRAPARGRRKGSFAKVHFGRHDSPKHLANLIRGSCGCKALCFSAYREHQIQEWLKLRKQLGGMTKLEKDQYVRVSQPMQSSKLIKTLSFRIDYSCMMEPPNHVATN